MNNTPARLYKVEQMSLKDEMEEFLMRNAPILLIIAIIILLLLIIAVCIAMVHGQVQPPAMVESGNYYYHLENII